MAGCLIHLEEVMKLSINPQIPALTVGGIAVLSI
jgi:hypothetical protein